MQVSCIDIRRNTINPMLHRPHVPWRMLTSITAYRTGGMLTHVGFYVMGVTSFEP